MYRTAKPGEFIFKRDSDGNETVECEGFIFATMRGLGRIQYGDGVPDGICASPAIDAAQRAGFWQMGTPARGQSPVTVTVQTCATPSTN